MKSFTEHSKDGSLDEGYNQGNVDELAIYVDNDANLYRQRISPIRKNLSRKHKAGKYDSKLADKIWIPAAKLGAQMYEKEYGTKGDTIFSKADIVQVALQLKTEWEEEMNIGNYE